MTIDSVKEIFKEMFIEQQNVPVNIVSESTTLLQRSLDKLTMEIKDNKDRYNNVTKETDDLNTDSFYAVLSIETYQNITDYKLKDTENSIDKIKKAFKREIEKLEKDNDDNSNKLRILEDSWRRDNLRFDGIEECEEESWADSQQNLKDTLSDILGI